MTEAFCNQLLRWDRADFAGWTSARYIQRAKGYLGKVKKINHLHENAIVANVQGTKTYTTKVYLNSNGELEGECSCPVGGRCKHAVALAYKAAKSLKEDAGNIANRPKEVDELEKRILFLFVILPGIKTVTLLRVLTKVARGSVSDTNLLVLDACEALVKKDISVSADTAYTYGNAQKKYRLAKKFSVSELKELAVEAEARDWWPDRTDIEIACNLSTIRSLTVEEKAWYQGHETLLEECVKGFRYLLLGEGELLKASEARCVFMWQWLEVVKENEDILATIEKRDYSIAFEVQLLDLAFSKARPIARSLEKLIEHCKRKPAELGEELAAEVIALCVWCGKVELIKEIATTDVVKTRLQRFVDCCFNLGKEESVLELHRTIGPTKSTALRLLAITSAIRDGADKTVIAKLAEANGSKQPLFDRRIMPHPYLPEVNQMLYAGYMAFAYLVPVRNRNWRDDMAWEYALSYSEYLNDKKSSLISVTCSFLVCELAKISGVKLKKSKLNSIARNFERGGEFLQKGYPTVAGIIASSALGIEDALQVKALADGVNAQEGTWLLPFATPESDWKSTIEDISSALRGMKKRGSLRPEEEPIRGTFQWVLEIVPRRYNKEQDETFEIAEITCGIEDENGVRIISFEEAASPRYAEVRSEADNAILCAAAVEFGRRDFELKSDLIELLLDRPNLVMIEERDFYRAWTRTVPIEFRKGEMEICIKREENGDITLAIPNWTLATEADAVIRKEGKGLYVYYRFSKALLKLLKVFKKRSLNGMIRLPKEAEESMRDIFEGIADICSVKNDAGIFSIPTVRLSFDHDEMIAKTRLAQCKSEVIEAFHEALEGLSYDAEGDSTFHFPVMEDALEFLMRLKAMGDELQIEWPKGKAIHVGKIESAKLSDAKNERGWFEVQGEFRLDEQRVLNIREMLEALKNGEGAFLRLSERQFVKITDSLRKRLEVLSSAGIVRSNKIEVPRVAIPSLMRAFLDEEEGAVLPKAMKEAAEKFKNELSRKILPPSSLKAVLRTYQKTGFEWLERLASCSFGSCLADDMGLGKTVQMITLLLSRATEGPSLVIAPASVCGNWKSEISRFAPDLRVVMGWELDETSFKSLKAKDVVIVSFGIIVSRERAFVGQDWNGVILDEAQAIKNAGSKRAKVVKRLRAKFRVAATGTPVENRLLELWSIFDFLNPGLLGAGTTFAKRLMTEEGLATDSLKQLVKPFILRRLKSEVLRDLPEKTEITLNVTLGEAERTAYEACRLQALESLKNKETDRISILAELTRLRRFCSHPSLVLPKFKSSAKLETLKELLDDLKSSGHRALIFSQFTDYLAIVREMLEKNGWAYQYLDGATSIAERAKRVEAFQSGKGDFFLISLKAGGMGINLTAASYVVLLDPWWNPAVEKQAADRVHRIGQKHPVTIYRLIAEQTVEEKVLELHSEKTHIAEDVLQGTGKTALSPEKLLSLFQ